VLLSIVTLGLGVLCLLPLICLLAIAAAILGVVAYFAQIAAVVENLGVMDSLRRAWDIIKANLGPIIILGLILIVANFVIGLILAVPVLLIVLPAVIGMAGFAGDSQVLGTGGLAFALVCCALYLPVLLVAGGILQTWTTAAWTLAYGQFTRPAMPGSQPAPSPSL
jgi:hypothetical protein